MTAVRFAPPPWSARSSVSALPAVLAPMTAAATGQSASPVKRVASVCYRGAPPQRRRDFVLAVLCAAALHAAFFFGDLLFPASPAVRPVPAPAEEIIQFEIPLPAEEPPKTTEAHGEETADPVLSPPMLADVPIVTVSVFTQPIQIAPQNIQVGASTVRVPVGRPGSPLGKGFGAVFDLNNIDQAPTLRSHVPPDFPLELRRSGTSGSVTVEFVVDRDGNVASARAVEASHTAFESPAVNAVRRWKFRPGKKDGRVVNTRVRQVINFNMEKE